MAQNHLLVPCLQIRTHGLLSSEAELASLSVGLVLDVLGFSDFSVW